ncbi:MAG: transposase family protein [Desulfobulbaceae bacterium]|nr:transposase family protein [Desulfobulbaceae bacterium]
MCADITYIPMRRGLMYLFAIIDWYSRKVIAWELSNTLDTAFCLKCLKRALKTSGAPEIMNTDQGCQFTSDDWIECLQSKPIVHKRIDLSGSSFLQTKSAVFH